MSNTNSNDLELTREEIQTWRKIKQIAEDGNDAQVRKKKDGSYSVYELKMRLF